ncbi:hypothetical protein G6O67_001977 [Ophiocordyceps sinensis]|uniref:Uncharacterized protein n=1 Tax=Ophiocordyceps sinensis TaxID=72228 RepID=A0A8H4PTB8_9HYPO|nr:hypothetical protein G6O67_001977 [Ophiocordyceps sinensis]
MAAKESRASSGGVSLEPVAASVLAEREAARREALRARGPFGSGCRGVDEYVLMGGGFERGSVVGVSAEDEEGFGLVLGLQVVVRWLCREEGPARALVVTPKPAGPLLGALREGIAAEVEAEVDGGGGDEEEHKRRRVRACLDRVMLSCVFDVDGLCEVLSELDGEGGDEPPEVADSQDDDGAPPPPPPPSIVLVTHLSSLLTSLFAQREPSAAHAALDQLSRRLRALARAPPSSPLVMLLNSTAAAAPAPRSPSRPLDPALRSVFAPAAARPAFGQVFARLLDLHLLCTAMPPRTRAAAVVVAVEVLVDHLGLWLGRRGPRPSREQRWAPVRVVGGRVVDAVASAP